MGGHASTAYCAKGLGEGAGKRSCASETFVRGWLSFVVLLSGSGVLGASTASNRMNFDGARVGQTIRRELGLKNPSAKALTIRDAASSCSCLRVLSWPRRVGPGAEAVISVEYVPEKQGRAQLEVLVETDREADPVVAYRWEGDVQAGIAAAGAVRDVDAATVLIGVARLRELMRGGAVMLVDVRAPEQFNLCHIEGAANWPLRMVGNLASRREKAIILHGVGSEDDALEAHALRAKESGAHSVFVLRGGVRAWMAAGHPVIGIATESSRVALIQPVELLASRQDDWVVLDLGGGEALSAAGRMPGGFRIGATLDERTAFLSEVRSALDARKGASRLLFVSELGEQYEIVEREYARSIGVPVYYLQGGSRAYREFVAWRQSLGERREMTLAFGGEISGRTSARLQPRVGGGCKTCPDRKGTR